MSLLSHRSPIDGLRRIVLTGFMGSGKTTVGRLLADRIGWHFADLDDAIEDLLGRSVPQIFAEHGESSFRAAEVDALRKLIAESRIVIALGGGAPEAPGLRELLAGAPETAVVYLEGGFDTLYGRCTEQALDPAAVQRPLLQSFPEAEARYTRRLPLYAGIATLTVRGDAGSAEEVVFGLLSHFGGQVLAP